MASIATLPVYLSIGDLGSLEIGTIDLPVDGNGTLTLSTKAIADVLRAAVAAYEHPDQEEDPDAAS